jgi:hypothetical protein
MYNNWIQNNTLGAKEKSFLWFYDGEKITIKRKIKNNIELINDFSNNEINILMSYIKQSGRVALANNVTKVQDGTEKDGIGKFIYTNINKDISAAQAASQLVSIFYNANVVCFNGRKRNMEFWIDNINWKERILNYTNQSNLVSN